MKKLFLTGIALLLATGAAFAQDALLPPLEFDYDPPYTTKITRFTKLEELREACNRKTGMFLGCGGNRFIDGQLTCSIFILDNEWLHAYGMTYPKVLRHEMGHCNGWGGNHAGARVRGDRALGPRRVQIENKNEPWLWVDWLKPLTEYGERRAREEGLK
jgi:hypothetical protein